MACGRHCPVRAGRDTASQRFFRPLDATVERHAVAAALRRRARDPGMERKREDYAPSPRLAFEQSTATAHRLGVQRRRWGHFRIGQLKLIHNSSHG